MSIKLNLFYGNAFCTAPKCCMFLVFRDWNKFVLSPPFLFFFEARCQIPKNSNPLNIIHQCSLSVFKEISTRSRPPGFCPLNNEDPMTLGPLIFFIPRTRHLGGKLGSYSRGSCLEKLPSFPPKCRVLDH